MFVLVNAAVCIHDSACMVDASTPASPLTSVSDTEHTEVTSGSSTVSRLGQTIPFVRLTLRHRKCLTKLADQDTVDALNDANLLVAPDLLARFLCQCGH